MSALVAKELQEQNKILEEILSKRYLDKVYPVGSIYLTVNNMDPSVTLGGTWQRIKDTFLLAAGDEYGAGTQGGSATHTLTIDEMPSHDGHLYSNAGGEIDNNSDNSYFVDSTALSNQNILNKYKNRPFTIQNGNELNIKGYSKGGGKPYNQLPPYLAVYVWKRTA